MAASPDAIEDRAADISDAQDRKKPLPSEDELALRFVGTRPDVRYVAGWSKWLTWDGGRWVKDDTLDQLAAVRQFVRSQSKDRGLRSAATIYAVERLARSDPRVAATVGQWDADPWLLNTPGGVVDLRTGALSPAKPEQHLTKQAAVAPAGECPRWVEFLDEVTQGDAALAAFLQRVAGYCLSGSTREHALFFVYGTGRNGKGVFLNTLSGILGDYALTADMATFTETHGDRHSTDLARLQGARLVSAQETDQGRAWAEARIKQLTGGDPVTARFMRQDDFTYNPQFKLLIAGNHRPRLATVDEAMRARLHMIPFTVTIPEGRRDPELPTKLRAEWPGILAWAVAGCLDYLDRGLAPPDTVRAFTDSYFVAQDTLSEFLEDRCEQGPGYFEVPTRLYAAWKRFAVAVDERPGRPGDFHDRLLGKGFRQSRDAKGRRWLELRLRDDLPDFGGQ